MYYTSWGSVRQGCGHAHRTAEAAARCGDRDRRGCRRQGGYSDRYIRKIEQAGEAREYCTVTGPGVAEGAEIICRAVDDWRGGK